MLIELIAAVAAAFVGAGVAMLLRHLTRGAVPRVLIPVFAGLGMILVTVWSEYSWFKRTSGALPADIVVIATRAEPSWFRPWTYVLPFTSRFMALDRATILTNENLPDQRMAEVLVFAHREPGAKVPVLVDCKAGLRADIADGVRFDQAGAVTDADWQEMPADDPLREAICS